MLCEELREVYPSAMNESHCSVRSRTYARKVSNEYKYNRIISNSDSIIS